MATFFQAMRIWQSGCHGRNMSQTTPSDLSANQWLLDLYGFVVFRSDLGWCLVHWFERQVHPCWMSFMQWAVAARGRRLTGASGKVWIVKTSPQLRITFASLKSPGGWGLKCLSPACMCFWHCWLSNVVSGPTPSVHVWSLPRIREGQLFVQLPKELDWPKRGSPLQTTDVLRYISFEDFGDCGAIKSTGKPIGNIWKLCSSATFRALQYPLNPCNCSFQHQRW